MTDKKESPETELNPSGETTTTATPESSTQHTNTLASDTKAEHSSEAPQAPAIQSSNGKALSGIAIAVGIAALALSGWQYYQSNFIAKSDTALAQAQNKIIALEQQITRIERTAQNGSEAIRKLAPLPQQVDALTSRTAQAKQESELALLDLSSKINRLSNVNKDDWLLAEAEYLIRLANQRLLLERDTQSTIALLENADDILGNLKDPIMFETRKAIAQDIQALKSISQFDLEGRYLQLAALYDQVEALPQREPSQAWQTQQSSTTEIPASALADIKALASQAWGGLKSLIVVNYNQKPIEPLLPPSDYQELVTGIQLQIEVAQVALLKGEKGIYDKALERIARAVSEHFDPKSSTTTAFMTTLTSLQQVNPNPSIPLPRASLQAMRQLMQTWQQESELQKPDVTEEAPVNNTPEETLS